MNRCRGVRPHVGHDLDGAAAVVVGVAVARRLGVVRRQGARDRRQTRECLPRVRVNYGEFKVIFQ